MLEPTVEDVDLVLSWLPPRGAEDWRARLLQIRQSLMGKAATDSPRPRTPSAEMLFNGWMAELQAELVRASPSRACEIRALLSFLDVG